MEDAYSDIRGLQRPTHSGDLFSRRHPKMARLNRAKLFAPFAALSGFESAVRAKEVPYVPRRLLDAEAQRELNRALNRLRAAAGRDGPRARVEYFEVCADANHEAFGRDGLYRAITGVVQRVDPAGQVLVVGGRAIPFADLGSLSVLEDGG